MTSSRKRYEGFLQLLDDMIDIRKLEFDLEQQADVRGIGNLFTAFSLDDKRSKFDRCIILKNGLEKMGSPASKKLLIAINDTLAFSTHFVKITENKLRELMNTDLGRCFYALYEEKQNPDKKSDQFEKLKSKLNPTELEKLSEMEKLPLEECSPLRILSMLMTKDQYDHFVSQLSKQLPSKPVSFSWSDEDYKEFNKKRSEHLSKADESKSVRDFVERKSAESKRKLESPPLKAEVKVNVKSSRRFNF